MRILLIGLIGLTASCLPQRKENSELEAAWNPFRGLEHAKYKYGENKWAGGPGNESNRHGEPNTQNCQGKNLDWIMFKIGSPNGGGKYKGLRGLWVKCGAQFAGKSVGSAKFSHVTTLTCEHSGGRTVGLYGKAGKRIDSLGIICEDLKGRRWAGTHSGGPGGEWFSLNCRPGHHLTTLDIRAGKDIAGLKIGCTAGARR